MRDDKMRWGPIIPRSPSTVRTSLGAGTDYIYIMHNNIFVKRDLKFFKCVVLNIDILYIIF